jgi:hypothetical protein
MMFGIPGDACGDGGLTVNGALPPLFAEGIMSGVAGTSEGGLALPPPPLPPLFIADAGGGACGGLGDGEGGLKFRVFEAVGGTTTVTGVFLVMMTVLVYATLV